MEELPPDEEGGGGPSSAAAEANAEAPSFLRRFRSDSRTEWAVRYAALHAIFYALFFYPPTTKAGIDWSLPVQLVSGGNLAFYSAGWTAWFGLASAFAMVLAGCILGIIFPLLQSDNLLGAYLSLMAIFLLVSLPMMRYIGVLNNLRSIGFVLIVIFTEVFYGPLLNFRSALPSAKSVFVEFVGPNALPALAFAAIGWAVYAVPPWHSATYQMLSLSSQVMGGVSDCLKAASSALAAKRASSDAESNGGAGERQRGGLKATLRSTANSLLEQTNFAGLNTPISLYGDMGIYETSISYPASSLAADSFEQLGKYVDQTVYHVAMALWALGEVIDEVDDEELLAAAARQLEAAGDLASATAAVLECPRKSYRQQPLEERFDALKESIATNPKLFDVAALEEYHTHSEAKELVEEALSNAKKAATELQETVDASSNRLDAALLLACVSDLTEGQQHLTHFSHDRTELKEGGSMGRMLGVAENLQRSWSDNCAWPRMVSRLTFLEMISDLAYCWCSGFVALLSCQKGGNLDKRQLARALQYIIGAASLFAMATWWTEYSSLLGSSSTGQWTMVAFFVCFRSTAEETVYAGIMRSIGHALGGLLSWGLNTAVTSSGGRIGVHTALTLVFTWLIPTPFSVKPSTFQFSFDLLTLTLLEGAMTTYHLTSVLVLSTSIESAAKARMASQCIGAATAAAVSLLICPWFAIPQAERTLDFFNANASLNNIGSVGASADAAAAVERLLQARRDIASSEEAKAWLSTVDTSKLSESLTNATFGQVAIEAMHNRYEMSPEIIPDEIKEALKGGDLSEALGIVREAISNRTTDSIQLAKLYIEISLLRESLD